MTICVSFWNRTLSHEVNDANMKESETQDDEIEADEDGDDVTQKKKKQSKEVVTSEMVDSWCNAIKEHGKLSTSHSLMKRTSHCWTSHRTTLRCEKKWKRKTERQDQVAMDEDIVQELVLSSDEEDGS
ncbi:nucleolar complex protein 2-like protein [Pyrus ussuriensis x Pyrus communis]|uniref:Nucleolar complex protein 2-like protein n=1 Tax=Pyrus ussuriensis x Pyrus communis TaxID=2448454 RepID=A0A5N5GNX6_9ROSA|nr:nucleolar complex protein 2-like protein [Pyrus ussuriensis x Pyrus communis]